MKSDGEATTDSSMPREGNGSLGSETERQYELILRKLEELVQEVGALREDLERREDLAQEIGEIKDDLRYMMTSRVYALEDEAHHHRATLRARAHLEGRPDLEITSELDMANAHDRDARWGRGAGDG